MLFDKLKLIRYEIEIRTFGSIYDTRQESVSGY